MANYNRQYESPLDYIEERMNIFNDLDQKDNFYKHAKHEIAGYNRPATFESNFYSECQQ